VIVEASTAVRQAEVTAARTMIARVQDRFELRPERLAAETVYGSAEMLDWLVREQGVESHIPVWDKSTREAGTFTRSDFAYDLSADAYTCPAGNVLVPRRRAFSKPCGNVPKDDTYRYRAGIHDCGPCALKPGGCPNTPAAR
jgi:hypothetical protein